MHRFKEITPQELENTMKLIGKDWMLITASDGNNTNTMTASWGSMGVLWNKNICTVYIRPQRYTYGIVENSERLTLSFFDERYRPALQYCGTRSGRDCNKFEDTGLTLVNIEGTPAICEAKLILVCKKLYADDVKKECFIEQGLLSNYKENDFHRFYICEIEKVLKRIAD